MSYTIGTPFGELPREPQAYNATGHFKSRLRYRDDPKPTSTVIKKCITEGFIRTTKNHSRFIFEQEVENTTWWLIVGYHQGVNDWQAITIHPKGEE